MRFLHHPIGHQAHQTSYYLIVQNRFNDVSELLIHSSIKYSVVKLAYFLIVFKIISTIAGGETQL
jgi:hypothetical protein